MSSENKLIFGTVIATIIFIGLIFIFIFSTSDNKELNTETIHEFLIRDDTYLDGNPNASISLVVFEDFQCPACQIYNIDIIKIRQEFSNDIKFAFRHYPIINIHQNALIASLAAESAGAQSLFYKYADLLYEKQEEWSDLDSNDKIIDLFINYAKELGVKDLAKFKNDILNKTYENKINRDVEDGNSIGINATPTIFLNDKQIYNPTYDNIKKEILQILNNQ